MGRSQKFSQVATAYDTGGALSFRNQLINADFRVNQRSYVSGTNTSGANQYTLDRWRVVTSGQNISWTTSGNVITVTAPAGGMEQVIEGINLNTGTYVLSWTGTATATVGGTSVANGGTVSVTGGSNLTIRFTGGTVRQPQFEPGTVPTSFEQRHMGHEVALCQRYFEAGSFGFNGSYQAGGSGCVFYANFRATKRATPTIATSGVVSANLTSPSISALNTESYTFGGTATTAGVVVYYGAFTASAEL